jgi:hypothetical protein
LCHVPKLEIFQKLENESSKDLKLRVQFFQPGLKRRRKREGAKGRKRAFLLKKWAQVGILEGEKKGSNLLIFGEYLASNKPPNYRRNPKVLKLPLLTSSQIWLSPRLVHDQQLIYFTKFERNQNTCSSLQVWVLVHPGWIFMDKRCAPNRYTEKCSLSASCLRKRRAAGVGTS